MCKLRFHCQHARDLQSTYHKLLVHLEFTSPRLVEQKNKEFAEIYSRSAKVSAEAVQHYCFKLVSRKSQGHLEYVIVATHDKQAGRSALLLQSCQQAVQHCHRCYLSAENSSRDHLWGRPWHRYNPYNHPSICAWMRWHKEILL